MKFFPLDIPITSALRIAQALGILGFGICVLCVGIAVLLAVGRSSPERRRHGKYVLGWMVAGWISAGLLGVYFLDGIRYYPFEADFGAAGFGLLVGWAVGMIHGSVVGWLWPLQKGYGMRS